MAVDSFDRVYILAVLLEICFLSAISELGSAEILQFTSI